MARVSALTVAPVKGMRVAGAERVEIDSAGARGDRLFFVRLPDGGIAMTTRHPALTQVVPAFDAAASRLSLRFPDGSEVEGPVALGEPVRTPFYDGRPVAGRLVDGPFAAAIGAHLGRPVQLVAREPAEHGGDDAPVTLMSEASLAALARAGGGNGPVDGRRFRMTMTIDGVEEWEEHGWGGREVAVGEAVLRVRAPVGRCVVTTRDPDDGRRDLPVLRTLAQLRGSKDVTFGVWLDVVRPGAVRVGDELTPAG